MTDHRRPTRSRPGGRDELLAWLQTPPNEGQPPRDELLIKVLVAVGVTGIDVGEVVQAHRRHLVQLMQRYTNVKAEASTDDVALALIVDAELFRIEAAVRWLDAAEVRLRRSGPIVMPERPPANTLLEAARRRRVETGAQP